MEDYVLDQSNAGGILTPVLLRIVIFLPVLYYIAWFTLLDPLRNVPGPYVTRISSFWLMLQSRLGRRSVAVHQLHQRYGNVVRIASNHVSINQAQALHEVYGHPRAYPKGPWYAPFRTGDPTSTHLLAIEDVDEHQQLRKDLTPAFSARRMREFEIEGQENYIRFKRQLLDKFESTGTDKAQTVEVDMNEWTNLLAFDLISEFSFGQPFGFLDKGYDFLGLIEAIEKRLTSINAIGVAPEWIGPCLRWIPFDVGFWRASAEGILKVRRLVVGSYKERLRASYGTPDVERKDMLKYMLHAKSTGGSALPEARIIGQATALIVAGSDSTAASISHFVDVVSRDLELQRKIQAEIDMVFPGEPSGDWVPMEVDTNKLTFTKAVLYEVLRVRPTAAQGFERVVTHRETVFGGFALPPGTLISVPTYSVHRDANVYPDPDTFAPERWLAEDTSRQLQTFNIFSTGPRNCIGQTFAWMEMMKTIALLFKLFRIHRATNQPTVFYEGFFLKAQRLDVRLQLRF